MPLDIEPEMEAFLNQLIPNLDAQLQGATDEQIQRIEEIAGRPLPRFYRWFLKRMGTDMGPLSYPYLDFSASKILDCYAQGLVPRDPRYLLIGYSLDDHLPKHQFYDFGHPARDDARVTEGEDLDDELYDLFETFREMIAWGELVRHRLNKFPQKCEGFFSTEGGDVLDQLDPLMVSLGFKSPIPTGPCCALYDEAQAALAMSNNPSDYRPHRRRFSLAGSDTGSLRRLLGEITTGSSLEVEIKRWLPPLG
jgi:hypothetical protein